MARSVLFDSGFGNPRVGVNLLSDAMYWYNRRAFKAVTPQCQQ
jgi:hypothetical protein